MAGSTGTASTDPENSARSALSGHAGSPHNDCVYERGRVNRDRYHERQLHAALSETNWKEGDDTPGPPFSVSIPCQLTFVDTPSHDFDRFETALAERELASTEVREGRQHTGEHPRWTGEIVDRREYQTFKLYINGGTVRIFPRNHIPAPWKLSRIISAIEVGFSSPLYHDPIENDDTGA